MVIENNIFKEIRENEGQKKNTIEINSTQLTDFNFLNEKFFKKNPIIYNENQIWYQWNSKKMRWERVDETAINISFNKFFTLIDFKNSFQSSVKTMVVNALKNNARIFSQYVKEIKETWVVFKDKIVDIATGEIFDNSYEYFSVNPLPYEISKSDDVSTPTIDKYVYDWLHDDSDSEHDWTKTLYEMFAYCMLPSYPIESIFVLHGNGSNGKSTCTNLLANFLSLDNLTSLDIDDVGDKKNRFSTSNLYHKLACIMGELDDKALKSTNTLKRLVSGKDTINAEYKNKSAFQFVNYAKVIMVTNFIPQTYDLSDAYFRRFIIIDFKNKFEQNGLVMKKIPDQEYENLARKLIPILQELYKNNKFTNEGNLEFKKKRYMARSNPIQSFIDETCDINPNLDVPVFEFYDQLEMYLQRKNYKMKSKKAVSQYLKSTLEIESKLRKTSDGKTWRYYNGIGWKDDFKNKEIKFNKNENKFNLKETVNIKEIYTYNELLKLYGSANEIQQRRKTGQIYEVRSGEYKLDGNSYDEV